MKIAKWKLIVSSVFVLLPGVVLALTSGSLGGLFVSAVLLAAHIFCIVFTAKDPGNKDQSSKVFDLILWIIPVISAMQAVILKTLDAGIRVHPALFINLLMGVMSLAVGNYLPKTRRNSTIGIKIKWTLENDENWNATHRFGGKVWVISGVAFLAAAFLPESLSMAVMFLLVAVIVLLPTVYSYRFYRRQMAEGSYVKSEMSLKGLSKKWAIGSVAVILVLVAVLMVTGEIHYSLGENSLQVSATYWQAANISFEDITDVVYLDDYTGGYRAFGFGSPKLSLGNFQSDSLGSYIRYTYGSCGSAVAVYAEGKTYVLSAKTEAETHALYETLCGAIKP